MTIFWHRLSLLGLLLLTACFAVATLSDGDSIQPLSTIADAVVVASTEQARQHGYENVNVEVRPLDSRLRLPQCANALSAFTPPGSGALGALSVGVRCTGDKPWTIYVRANVSAQMSIPVLTRTLPRHALITESDIEWVNRPQQSSSQDIIYDLDQIVGMELTRSLGAGSPIKSNQLRRPKVVARGQQIILIAGSESLEVRMQGKALRDAVAGERVKVTNLSSGQQVEGIANTDGTVSVQ
ncbi:MAG: flagellar basal body P-ring formation chaperone FlgA [Porticoccus sp.]